MVGVKTNEGLSIARERHVLARRSEHEDREGWRSDSGLGSNDVCDLEDAEVSIGKGRGGCRLFCCLQEVQMSDNDGGKVAAVAVGLGLPGRIS